MGQVSLVVILKKRLLCSLITLINAALPAVQDVDQSRSRMVVIVTAVAVGLRVVGNGGGWPIYVSQLIVLLSHP